MWQSGIVAKWRFMPVFAVGFLNPAIALPSGDDVAQSRLTTVSTLQGTEVIHCERGSQLVEHRVVGSITLALFTRIDILILQCLAEFLSAEKDSTQPSLAQIEYSSWTPDPPPCPSLYGGE